MALTDELKIRNDKIKANQTHYDLDREAAAISALSSKELDKYKYLTGEDLGYKPGVAEQAKFEYSPLGKIFNKGLEKEDEKEGLLKRLENIEDKNEEQLQMIKNKDSKDLSIKSVTNIFDIELSEEAETMITKLKNQEKKIDYKRLSFKKDKNWTFHFRDYMSLKEFFKYIYYRNISIENAEMKVEDEFNADIFNKTIFISDMIFIFVFIFKPALMMTEDKFNAVLNALKKYSPKNPEYIKEKINFLDNVKNFYDGRNMIINAFKDKIFPFYHESRFEDKDKDKDHIRDENGLINYKKLDSLIFLKERVIYYELVRKHFLVHNLRSLLKNLEKSRKNTEKNKVQVNLIESRLNDLKNEIKVMSKYEKETEQPNEIVDIVENILEFNNQNEEGKGLKILSPDQMLSR